MLLLRSLTKEYFENIAYELANVSMYEMKVDFHYTFDNELLVLPVSMCSSSKQRLSCGCGWSFTGTESKKSTSLGIVEASAISSDELRYIFQHSKLAKAWSGAIDVMFIYREKLEILSTKLYNDGFIAGDIVHIENDNASFSRTDLNKIKLTKAVNFN